MASHGTSIVDQLYNDENVSFQHKHHGSSFVIQDFEMLLQKFRAAREPRGDMKSFTAGLQERIRPHHVEASFRL